MDSIERQQALDTDQSFIVQAPAGSGKTELLTQRYLALLATVEHPEQILALTFTRKAAQEMRHRILMSIQEANLNVPLKNSHQQTTRHLAEQVLKQNLHYQWNLLNNPNLLKITTFDAFCLDIYQSVPRNEQSIIPNITENPEFCYRQAIQTWFNWCRENTEYHASIKCLLKACHNQPQQLFKHLQKLLTKRDQWMPILHHQASKSEEEHRELFQQISQQQWQQWSHSLTEELQTELFELIQLILPFLNQDKFTQLRQWKQFKIITPAQLIELTQLLFTGDLKSLRKCLDHHVGLTQEACPDKNLLKSIKEKSKQLLSALQDISSFSELLKTLFYMPNPDDISIDWTLLKAFYQLLPLLVACLHLEFEKQQKSDFIYIAQQARFALLETDISIYLENQLSHLLIDEFQDTSSPQLELIEGLTQNWEQHPEKTLFIVGDPMQSIYRFRNAEVGIFLQIQQQGLKNIKLKPLYLKQNFRSAPELIHPFNEHFSQIFPQQELIELGGVKFHCAIPALPSKTESSIQAEYYENIAQQTERIIEIIKQAHTEKIESIAILVKNRKQLPAILEALQQHQLSFQGVDLIPLGQKSLIKDVWSIVQLLINPQHKINELSVLRGPFIGLSLEELHLLGKHSSKQNSLFHNINLDMLSDQSKQRLSFFMDELQQTQKKQYQLPFIELIQSFFLKLGIEHLLSKENYPELLKFYDIIEHFSSQFTWPDAHDIDEFLNQCYISSNQVLSLQIMTIHKSKGLEFDWVILPDMGSAPQTIKLNALEWLNISNETLFLTTLSSDPIHQKNNHLFKWYEKKQIHHETQRLCYVAFTRARTRLFLLDSSDDAKTGSFRALFATDFFQKGSVQTKYHTVSHSIPFTRLPLAFYQNTSCPAIRTQNLLAFQDGFWQKQIGIITHRILQWICEFHPISMDEIPWQIAIHMLKAFDGEEKGLPIIQKLIKGFWYCPIGEWIRSPHSHEKNEFSLLIRDELIMREAIIDRMFIEHDTLWIIDFKTSIDSEDNRQKYQLQVNQYAAYLSNLYPNHRIKCGLYFLANLHWKHWDYQTDSQTVS
jgi:ATP-dependent exoDNAse (exonuclease V) beta subunit